ncbi:MAG TPA: lipoprotein insertase outer membrane protein LolB [Gammaproteobacteria bacterium]|nr:lipoprotein insertase outer membrane protein LolB [Gammaproteobacteria bacterium]
MTVRGLWPVSLLLLASCVSVPGTAPEGPPNEAAWQARAMHLQSLNDWELQGRIGIVTGQHGGSGSMDWRQQGLQVAFSFRGPFGAGTLEVRGDSRELWVRSSRGDDFITTDPEKDFAARLKVPLPVLSMRFWMRGLPDPDAPFAKTVDARGQLVTLTQHGWQVNYQDYAEFGGYDLPTRMLIRRDDTRIKVAVNNWQVGPAVSRTPVNPR